MEKHYSHQNIENKWYERWESSGVFHSEPDKNKKPFTMVIPPPNVTGVLHMGHVLNNTIQDIMGRYKKMNGYNMCWVPGTDHAGIATQTMVEKHLRKEGIDPDALSREDFLARVWSWREQYGGIITKQLRKLGSCCDWQREKFTMDDDLSRAVLEAFVRLYDKGWIYRGSYIVNWCPALQTALSDDEVDRSEEDSFLWHFRYPLVDSDEVMIVATTRPETMLGDTGVAVNPNDPRYQHLVGKKVRLPIVGREMPVFADELVQTSFGTGCVKITPSHDANDFEMGKRHHLEFITVIDKGGKMNQNVPAEFQGMDRFECRDAVVAKMQSLGLLEKTEPHVVAVGRCYRTKDVIEPYMSEQWFIKMEHMAQRALKPVLDGTVKFYPSRWIKTYEHWMNNIRDWCISRQLKWGHRIPVWTCESCGKETCAVETPVVCAHCQSDAIKQDPDVLDTWASSWLWPISVFGWPEKTEDLAYYYPTQTLVTAADIIFFWVARMIMSGLEFMDEVPFTEVYFNGIVRDMQGRKMSKTLGNSPDPLDIIDQYGADALRFTIVYQTPYGADSRFSADACDLGRGFCTKIWNANRFLHMSFEGVDAHPDWRAAELDFTARWILSRLNTTIEGVNQDMQTYRLANACSRIYNFFWGEFCDWYVEFIKPLIAEADETGKGVLYARTRHVIDTCLRLLHPFMPFVTEEIWHHLNDLDGSDFLINQTWPEVEAELRDEAVEQDMKMVQELITAVRSVRKAYQIPRKAPLKTMIMANDHQYGVLESLQSVLTRMVGLAETERTMTPPEQHVALALSDMTVYVDLRNHLDVDAELLKIDKKLAKLDQQILALQKRLGNEGFVKRAPANVVEKNRDDLEALLRQQETLQRSRSELSALK